MTDSGRGVKVDVHNNSEASIQGDEDDGNILYMSEDDQSGTFQSLRRTSHAKLPRERRLRRAMATLPRTMGLPRFLTPRVASRSGSTFNKNSPSRDQHEPLKMNENDIQMSSLPHSISAAKMVPYLGQSRSLEIRTGSDAHSSIGRMPQSARAFSVNVDHFDSSFGGSDFDVDSRDAYYIQSANDIRINVGTIDESQTIAKGSNIDEGSPVSIIYERAHRQPRAYRLAKMRRALRLGKQDQNS